MHMTKTVIDVLLVLGLHFLQTGAARPEQDLTAAS
jgi:hypothetical protein